MRLLTRGRRLSLASRSFRNWSSIVIGNFAPMPISWISLRGRVCRGETRSEADSSKSIDFGGNFVASGLRHYNGFRGTFHWGRVESGVERIIGLIYEETRGGGGIEVVSPMGRVGKCVASCVDITTRRQEEHRITTSIYINVSLTAYIHFLHLDSIFHPLILSWNRFIKVS